MANILERVALFAQNEGITIGSMEKTINASKGVLSRAVAQGTDIQAKWIKAIVENYPHLSPEWLITGEGEMLRQSDPNREKTERRPREETNERLQMKPVATGGIPLIPIDAVAGFNGWDENGISELDCARYDVPDFAAVHADFLIRVSGSSMYPKYSSGDILACRKILELLSFNGGRSM